MQEIIIGKKLLNSEKSLYQCDNDELNTIVQHCSDGSPFLPKKGS